MERKFIETKMFQELLEAEGDKWLEKRIKDEILKDPEKGDLIKGTGGFRKIRVSKKGMGKSGGHRVIYFDLKEKAITYLVLVYSKNAKENIDKNTQQALKKLSEVVKNEYNKES